MPSARALARRALRSAWSRFASPPFGLRSLLRAGLCLRYGPGATAPFFVCGGGLAWGARGAPRFGWYFGFAEVRCQGSWGPTIFWQKSLPPRPRCGAPWGASLTPRCRATAPGDRTMARTSERARTRRPERPSKRARACPALHFCIDIIPLIC